MQNWVCSVLYLSLWAQKHWGHAPASLDLWPGRALGGEFGIGAICQVFYFCRLYSSLRIDGMNVVEHPCTIENEEAVRGIYSSERLEL